MFLILAITILFSISFHQQTLHTKKLTKHWSKLRERIKLKDELVFFPLHIILTKSNIQNNLGIIEFNSVR